MCAEGTNWMKSMSQIDSKGDSLGVLPFLLHGVLQGVLQCAKRAPTG